MVKRGMFTVHEASVLRSGGDGGVVGLHRYVNGGSGIGSVNSYSRRHFERLDRTDGVMRYVLDTRVRKCKEGEKSGESGNYK